MMKFRKTLFFEIPSKDFIMPIYTEGDVQTLKSFLDDDEVLFSIGYKSQEDKKGYYYIGQVKAFTETFCLKDFPAVNRKRIMDILNGLNENPKFMMLEENIRKIKKIVYFKETKNGPKPFVADYNDEIFEKLERLGIQDYSMKEVEVFVMMGHGTRNTYTEDEIFYRIKNPNF